MSASSAGGASTRADAPQPRIQLRSARSLQTSSVSTTPPSGVSRSDCDGCQTRARTNGATRVSNAISTCEGGPVFTPSELPNTSSGIVRVGVNVCLSSETDTTRSMAKVRTSLYSGPYARRYNPPCSKASRYGWMTYSVINPLDTEWNVMCATR